MALTSTALTSEEVNTIRSAIRAGRVVGVLGLALAVPYAIEALAPVLGVALLVVILASPVLVTTLLVLVARRSAREQRLVR